MSSSMINSSNWGDSAPLTHSLKQLLETRLGQALTLDTDAIQQAIDTQGDNAGMTDNQAGVLV